MISKIIIGSDSYGCCRYVCGDEERAKVIESNGVRDFAYKLMAQDFESNRDQQPGKTRHVFHGILSFPKQEHHDDEKIALLAKEYLKELGMSNSPFVIVTHNDKDHQHAHVISSLVDLDGHIIDDSWIGLRGKKAAQRITEKHNLIPANKKNIAKMNLSALNKREQEKIKAYLIIDSAVKRSRSFRELEGALKDKNIDTLYKYKRRGNEIQGISFAFQQYTFKGSEIDRKFSFRKLSEQLQQNALKNKGQANKNINNQLTGTKEPSSGIVNTSTPANTQINLHAISLNAGTNYKEDEKPKRKKRKPGPRLF